VLTCVFGRGSDTPRGMFIQNGQVLILAHELCQLTCARGKPGGELGHGNVCCYWKRAVYKNSVLSRSMRSSSNGGIK
jgi:hypothetical protein